MGRPYTVFGYDGKQVRDNCTVATWRGRLGRVSKSR